MKRDIILYTLILSAALGAAYWASIPQKTSKVNVVEWVDLNEGAISSITFRNNKSDILAERINGKFWVTVTPIEPEAAEGEAPKEQKPAQRFRVSQKFKDLLSDFSPLEVLRVIGAYDEAKAEEFGFEGDGASTVIVNHKSGKVELKLGRKAYSSSKRFVLDVAKDKVLLIEGRNLESLEKAQSRLFERKLFDFDWDDVVSGVVAVGEASKELDHTKRDADGVLGWSEAKAGSKNKTIYQTWFDKIGKLRVKRYLDDASMESIAGLKPFLRVSFLKSDGTKEDLQFVKQELDDSSSYFISSTHLDSFVEVPKGRLDTIEKDIKSIMAE